MMQLPPRVRRFGGIIGSQTPSRQPPAGPAGARLVAWHGGDAEPAEVKPAGGVGGRLYVSLVGGLDNLRELIDELAKHGHRLAQKTEIDVIAHAYERWGEACIKRFRGDFAIAVWDARNQTLLLARDRSGARSLYYQPGETAFAFASDLATLRALTNVPHEVDPQAIDAYMTFRAVPAPLSIFRSVRKLPAAHVLRLANGIPDVKPYWSIDFGQKESARTGDIEEHLAELLRQAAREMTDGRSWRLMLSGGLDSSILLDVLSGLDADPVPAFTFAFPTKPEEAESARRVAAHYAAEHRVFDMEPCIAETVSTVVDRFDQPYADIAALSLGRMTPLFRGKTEMVLTGEGADEVFCGRERHVACAMIARLGHIPGTALCANVCARLAVGRLRLLFDGMRLPMIDRYVHWVSTFRPAAKSCLYTPEFASRIDPDYPRALLRRAMPSGAHPLDQMLAADFGLWVPEVLGAKFDPVQGTDGVEMRSPFLDHRVVEFSARLLPSTKVGWGTTKAVLRRLARHRGIPVRAPLVRGVKTKISLAQLLRGELRPVLEESLFGLRARERGYFRPAAVRQLADEHLTGRADHSDRLWVLLMLEQWHRRQLDR